MGNQVKKKRQGAEVSIQRYDCQLPNHRTHFADAAPLVHSRQEVPSAMWAH